MIEDENIEQIILVDRVLNRFSPDFKKKIQTNPIYNQIYYMLLQGIDEYLIIEELLKINEKFSNDIIKLSENQQPKYFIKMPEEKK